MQTLYHIHVAVSTFLAPTSQTLREQVFETIGQEHVILKTVVRPFSGVSSTDLLCVILVAFAFDGHHCLGSTTSYYPIFGL
jgi:hypothetical protein